jgi:hypothetical protein
VLDDDMFLTARESYNKRRIDSPEDDRCYFETDAELDAMDALDLSERTLFHKALKEHISGLTGKAYYPCIDMQQDGKHTIHLACF